MAEEHNNQPFSDPNKPAPPLGWDGSVQQNQPEPEASPVVPPVVTREDVPHVPQQETGQAENNETEHKRSATRQSFSANDGYSLFGKNGRWLWFAGGVLFVLFGVLMAALFNMRKSPEDRNDAIKWAAIGMAFGVAINMITLYTSGMADMLLGTGMGSSASSGGSLF